MKSYTFEGYNQCLGSYLIFKNNCPFPFLKKLEIKELPSFSFKKKVGLKNL
jgi:hypothetical protein